MAVCGRAVRVHDRVFAVAEGQFGGSKVRQLRVLVVQQWHYEPVPKAQVVQAVDVQRPKNVSKVPTAQHTV